MRVLKIAPEAQWIKFDSDLSFLVRRITVHDAHDIVEGTSLARLFREAAGTEDVRMSERELLDLCDRIIDKMVTGWTVQDPAGADVPVSIEAAHWLLTETPNLAGWLINTVFLGSARAEAEITLEKGD